MSNRNNYNEEVTMKKAILDLISSLGGGVSWVEICNRIPGAKGDRCMYGGHNIILWNGVSDELINAVNSLIDDGMICAKVTSLLVYAIDGHFLKLPIGKRFPQNGYTRPRWVPVVFDLKRRRNP